MISSARWPGSLEQILREIGLPELHVHLRGAMPRRLLARKLALLSPREAAESAPDHFQRIFQEAPNVRQLIECPGPVTDSLQGFYRYRHLDDFLAAYLFSGCVISSVQDFEELVVAVLHQLATDGICYAEVTVSLVEYLFRGIAPGEVFNILRSTPAPVGLRVNWIIDLVRNMGVERCAELLDITLKHRFENLVGITLGGSEVAFPPAGFASIYRAAQAAGLRCSVHAGEALGAESVWDAISILAAERLGHGVRSIEDPELVSWLAENRIPLEVCLTGNIVTGVYRSFLEHPVLELIKAGVPVTLNTDDPAFFDTTLKDEYKKLASLGASEDQLLQVIRNGFEHSFLDDSEKKEYLNQTHILKKHALGRSGALP